MEFCRERDFQSIILEGDSLQVIQGLKERTPSWRWYGHLLDDTRALLGTYRRWMVQHVKRDANRAAHDLAKEGLRFAPTRQWFDESPECISAIVLSKQNAPSV
jgi:ribonuclease HI